MRNVLDDEFVIQMSDSPPFTWVRQIPNRFMNCNIGRRVTSLWINATGNSNRIAKMARDFLGKEHIQVEQSFSLSTQGANCLISYSGQLKEAVEAVEKSDSKGIVMSSGGVIKGTARKKGWDYIPLPKGYPSRFLFPEIFGCLLSLLGQKVEIQGLEEFVDKNMPSEITDVNEAKQLALKLENSPLEILYDESSEGLANMFRHHLRVNSGIECTVKEQTLIDMGNSGRGYPINVVSFVKGNQYIEGIRVGNFPYECRTFSGYVKNAIIMELASLYLGILKSHEIELFDTEIE